MRNRHSFSYLRQKFKQLRQRIRFLFPTAIADAIRSSIRTQDCVEEIRDLVLSHQNDALQQSHPNPLNRSGRKCFSQTDEDGITLEILKRIDCLEKGTFAEFGVGNGTENNTLILKALGWKGFWAGGENLAFEVKQPKEVFSYFRGWITLENIDELANEGKRNLACQEIDVISLDLDGNDIYFVEKLLAGGHCPKLFIVEYNAKFFPPVRWQIDYDPQHIWNGDDYFGASLASFNELFGRYSYRLVCCNAHTGANAFFVREEFASAFADVPRELNKLYAAPRYYLYKSYGHKPAIRTIARLFA